MKPASITQAILLGGLSAGVLDITAACIHGGLARGRSPIYVCQSVAGGLLGRDTFQGGLKTAALGLALHFFIAMTWAAVYGVASLRLPLLMRQTLICGVLYGLVIYLVMYAVVLPLSALNFKFFSQAPKLILINVLIHIFCIGLPIALAARWRVK